MLAVLFDDRFRVVGSRRRKSKGQTGVKSGVGRIVETIDQLLAETGVSASAVTGIGLGVPGMLDLNRGVLLHAPNLGWHHLPLRKTLAARFKTPVAIANDVDAGTYAEYRFGAARHTRCAVGVFPGTGIGGACIYEGRILRGKVGSCMEIGHVPVDPDGALCGCGRRGCLETVASRLAISAELAVAAYRGQAPHLLALAGTDIGEIRSGVIAAAIKAGDKCVDRVVRRAARRIGETLIGVVHLLAPDVIVLGGGLVEEMPALFLNEVRATLNKGVSDAFRSTFKVVAARCGDHATALGAAALAADMAAAPAQTRHARR
jgi:glucokinase